MIWWSLQEIVGDMKLLQVLMMMHLLRTTLWSQLWISSQSNTYSKPEHCLWLTDCQLPMIMLPLKIKPWIWSKPLILLSAHGIFWDNKKYLGSSANQNSASSLLMSQRNNDVKYCLLLENLSRHQKVPWIWPKSYDKGQYICQHIWLANIYVNTAQFMQKKSIFDQLTLHCRIKNWSGQ